MIQVTSGEKSGMNSINVEGKVAVVIGGTSGIGRTLALGLAAAGADVVATSRSLTGVKSVAGEIEALGRRTLVLPCDVTERSSLQNLHDQVIAKLGKVDILVNSAGITQKVPVLDWTEEEWDRILGVNLKGVLFACQVFGRSMIAARYGRIINIASLATSVAFHGVAAYGASKAAVGALTQSLAVEWAQHGVCVNAIAPGIFPTDLNRSLLDSPRGAELIVRTPMQRFGNPQELVGAAIYLASDTCSFTTGQILAIDGGYLASGVNQ